MIVLIWCSVCVWLQVLGWGEKWLGLSQKLQASLDYVRALDSDCILLFSDAFDIMFTSSLADIKDKVRQIRTNHTDPDSHSLIH